MNAWLAVAIVLVIVIAAVVALVARPVPGVAKADFSSFQFWSWDPAFSSPLQDPLAPRSQLFRELEGRHAQRANDAGHDQTARAGDSFAEIQPLQTSAAMTARPDSKEGFRRRWWRRHPRYGYYGWYPPFAYPPYRYYADRWPYMF